MRTTEQIKLEIAEKFGFFPPFFAPAEPTPEVLENLWQQTLAAYVNNPLPALFKEKLSAYLSRYCAVPYCMVCHSCTLRPLGMKPREVLELLESPPPTETNIDEHLRRLAAQPVLKVWPDSNSPLAESLLFCSIFIALAQDSGEDCRNQLRRILGSTYTHLVAFIAYLKTCLAWMEAHPEVAYEADKRVQENLGALLEEEPSLADFFRNYRERVGREHQNRVAHLAELAERQRREEVLRQAVTENLRLARAVAAASDGILITDPNQPDNPIIYANPAVSRIAKYQQDEIVGKNCRFLQGPGTDPQTVAQIRQAITERREVKATLLNYSKDGQPFWNELKISPVFSDEGDLLYFIGIQTDISERQQAEEALRQSEERFRLVVDGVKDYAIFMLDPDGRIVNWNAGAQRIKGYGAAEILGEHFSCFYTAADIQQGKPEQELRVATAVGRFEDEGWRLRKDGSRFWANAVITALRDQTGQLRGFATVTRDITERKQTEAALRHAKDELEMRVVERTAELLSLNQRLQLELDERKRVEEALERLSRHNQLILNSVGEGLCGLDLQGKITFVNPAAANLLGYKVEELIGQSIQIILPHSRSDQTSPLTGSHIHDSLRDGSVHQITNEVFRRQNGSRFPVEYVSNPIREQGAIVGAVVTFKDITDRQQVERMKDEFISVVSHELRTPLTSIHGSLGMLASGLLDPGCARGKRLLEIAVDSTDRLVRLINDILDIERIESGKVQMAKQACDAAELMTEAADVMQVVAEQLGVSLSVSTVSVQLWADPDRIIQALTNLLSNAIKFSPRGNTVWLTAQPQGDRILFQVRDQGRGIPADQLEIIFERFGQVDASDSRDHEGTGLGLAICRSIAQQHGGRIWVESTLGEGSTFYFTLPKYYPEPQG